MLNALAPFAHHLAGKGRVLAALFVLGLCGAAVSLAMPLLGKAFVDAVATRGEFSLIPKIAGALVVLGVLDVALAAWSSRLHARVSAEVLASMRGSLFRRCVDAPLERIERFRQGDLLTRFGSDAPRIQVLLVDGAIGGVQSVLFLAVAAAITFELSPALALWSFLGVGLALVAATAFRQPIEARTRRVRDAMVDLSHFLTERLAALRAIRLHRSASFECERLACASDRLNREVVQFQAVDAVAKGVPALFMTLALAWVYVLGGRLLESGSITLGTFVAFVLYQGRLFAPAQGLLGLVRNVQEARVSLARVREVLDDAVGATTPAVDAHDVGPSAEREARNADVRARTQTTQGVLPTREALVLRRVRFAYPGKSPVLRDLDLRVRTAERIALFGASGAGKSTLVQLVFGVRRPASGIVLIEGAPASGIGASEALGYAGAEPFLMHASVEENVRYGTVGRSAAEVEHALAIAEATAFVHALPRGLATVIGGRGLALSDGQRQRLGLARVVLQSPRILVLDEAFSALDLETEARIRERLWAALPGRAVLAVSHRPCGLDEFDRLMFLHDGRLTEVTPAQLQELVRYEPAWT